MSDLNLAETIVSTIEEDMDVATDEISIVRDDTMRVMNVTPTGSFTLTWEGQTTIIQIFDVTT